jgi:MEMO1 family protein
MGGPGVSSVRPPAVAGAFYPGEPGALRDEVDRLLGGAQGEGEDAPRALIAPHAGYAYSGPVAAGAFRRVAGAGGRLARVVVIGPSHRVAFRGIAAPRAAAAFRTPLGEVPVDRAAVAALAGLPGVVLADEPHRREHAVEVELPFLQRALGTDSFALVPLVVGDATEGEVAAALEPFADDPATLVVVSSDLLHFLPYEAAVRRDRATAGAIERLEGDRLGPGDACGHLPIRGWLAVARRRGLGVERLDLRNSGDTAGDRRSVVGYGAWAFV